MIDQLTAETRLPACADAATPQVSVAMATYNGERHILEQLNSLATQTLRPFELVVTDDGSTDATIRIIEQFAASAPFPVRLYRNPHRLGYADNFLQAAQLCSGEFVAFCDQDDLWLKDKLLRCLAPFEDAEVLISGHTARVWYGGDRFGPCVPHFEAYRIVPVSHADPLRYQLGFATVIRRSLLSIVNNKSRPVDMHSVGTQPSPMAHDQWVWFLAALFGKSAEIPETLCFYRQHANNLFGATPPAKLPLIERLRKDKAEEHRIGAETGALSATYIDTIMPGLPERLRPRALKAREALARRAELCRMRRDIYEPGTSLATRGRRVAGILRRDGYASTSRQFCFGREALVKDMLIGVTGMFRWFGQGRDRHPAPPQS
jgi:hypothetical protein